MITNTISGIMETYMYTIRLSVGLIILMSVNIILGVFNSCFESQFDPRKFFKGIGKAVILILCFGAVFFAGVLNKDTLSIDMGTNVPSIDIIDAMHAMMLAGYFLYSKEVLKKMNCFVGCGLEPHKEKEASVAEEAPNLLLEASETMLANEDEGEYV